MITKQAIERFNKTFRNSSWYRDNWKDIEDWIAKELSQQREKIIKMAELEKVPSDVHQDNCISKAGINNCDCATYHINNALQSLITKLKEI